MKKIILVLVTLLLASLPLLAMPQGLNSGAPWAGGGKVLASFPLTTSGPLIEEDANTVAHVYWSAGNVVNYALQSNSLSTSTSATSPWGLYNATVATVAGAPAAQGGGTWAEVTTTSTAGYLYAAATTASAATRVLSAWMAKASGSGYAGVQVGCGTQTPSTCSCLRSDGGTCAATVQDTNYCQAEVTDLGTTPVRLSAIVTCAAAVTTGSHTLVPGRYGTATGTTRFTGVQLETGVATPSELAVTTTVPVTINDRLVDTKGNAWTLNGAVPGVLANPFTTTRYGAGPFSASNYYSLGTGTDVLDFAGDFTVCVVGNHYPEAGEILYSNALGGGSPEGYDFQITSSGNAVLTSRATGGGSATAFVTVTGGGPFIACAGRAGATGYVKANAGTTGNGALNWTTPTTAVAVLGKSTLFPNPTLGTIYEFYATSTPWNEATVTAIQQRVLGHFDGSAPLAVTRTTNATYENPAGTIWTASPGVARITTDGLLVEPARTNYALQSDSMSTGTAATPPWVLSNASVATVAGAPLSGTWAEIAGATSAGFAYVNATVPSTTTLVASVWMAKASGSGYAAVVANCAGTTVAACSCLRSDGGACTANKTTLRGTDDCGAEVADLGTTPVRVSAIATCTAALTGPYLLVVPGRYGTATGTTRFTGAQLEVGTYPTSHISVGGTSTLRAADQISATVPAVPLNKWCIAATALPEERRTTADEPIWNLGTGGGANTARVSALNFTVVDAAAANKSAGASNFSGSVRYVACNNGGALTLTTTPGVTNLGYGVGSGVMASSPTTFNFGTYPGYWFGGYVKNLKICAAKSAKECK